MTRPDDISAGSDRLPQAAYRVGVRAHGSEFPVQSSGFDQLQSPSGSRKDQALIQNQGSGCVLSGGGVACGVHLALLRGACRHVHVLR